MKRTILLGAGVLAAALGAGAAWLVRGGQADAAGILPYRDAAALARGREIYAEQCASCHGEDREGQVRNWREFDENGRLPAPPHDETGHTWHHDDRLLFLITKFGSEQVVGNGYRSDMVGFGDVLSDDEILAVLAYIKSTWPEDVIEMHNQRNADAGG